VSATKETELVTAVLVYAIRCLAESDHHALRAMNFGPREVDALQEMNLADLYRVGSLQAHCLTVELNRDVFWPMLEHLQRKRASEETERKLVAADAPLEMMSTLFGVGSREYTRLRRLLGIAPSVGRPPEPDEEAATRIWEAWARRVQESGPTLLPAEEYLAIHGETGASLRAVWQLTQRWAEYGDLSLARR